MTRTFRSIVPGRGRGDDSAPRRPGKPVTKDKLDRAAAQADEAGQATDGGSAAGAEDRRGDEIGGPDGPEPTRYGDWERGGICYDF